MTNCYKSLVGRRFYRLLVLEQKEDYISPRGQKESKWLCLCDCGNEITVVRSSLISKKTCSCGCLQKELASQRNKLPDGEGAFNKKYSQYKLQAKNNYREFVLTEDQFRVLVTNNCRYCGEAPNQIWKYGKYNGQFVGNGIDRVDNSKGYTVENCVSCCDACNYMKRMMAVDEFLMHCIKVVRFSSTGMNTLIQFSATEADDMTLCKEILTGGEN